MSTYLRKCIDIAPTAISTPDLNPANDYAKLVLTPWWPALRATTSHIRFWADWSWFQDGPDFEPGGTPRSALSLAALDAHVKAATRDGLEVILVVYRYPQWANDTQGIVFNGQQDSDLQPWDRVSRVANYIGWIEGRLARPTYKDLRYRLPPAGHGPSSPWAKWMDWLWDRYVGHADRYGRVAAFEVTNEPNLQVWPQRSQVDTTDLVARWGVEGTHVTSVAATAEMMATLDAIARRYERGALCLGPSTSDSDIFDVPRSTTMSHRTPYTPATDTFCEALLTALDERGFTGGDHWIWSFHNYADIERDQHHIAYLRRLLVERGWAGRQLDGGPELWATEGGCRPAQLNATAGRIRLGLGRPLTVAEQLDYQAVVLTEALSRHHRDKGDGLGVGLMTQYTTYADGFNSGVLDGNGVPRPALAAWSEMPEYVASPVQRAAWRPQL
ncbi:hypothetical protein [Solirubrobacter soli]|uniref:hypothetical protein n=1 Tax=Solirubrobacter soli TaxID=363832 RepID=UPI0004002AFF|nr:hypothetical protein [Solirubrobacter soli]